MLIEAVDSYLAIRRAAGFKLQTAGYFLAHFAHFATERGETHVRVQSAIDWAMGARSGGQRDRRLKAVIRFARHARAEDASHEVPPDHFFAFATHRRRPHIFSTAEVQRILDAAGHLGPSGTLRPHTYATLFGLLATCGLRISEALALHLGDVTEDGLIIRNTKFSKNRLLPLHTSTETALAGYIERRRRIGGNQPYLFVSLRGRKLAYPTVEQTFRALINALGIRPANGNLSPRMHDLRHTFAVRVFEATPQARIAGSQHMLALTTYLGHVRVADTAWYLHATPTIMADIADACEAHEGRGPA